MTWQLQEAKNKFSEVVKRARSEGPQIVTLRGKPEAVVMSIEEYEARMKDHPNSEKTSFVDFLLGGPKWDDEMFELVNQRDKTPPRDIEL